MWFSSEKCVTPSPTGARSDADATAVLNCGSADGLSEHNTPNSDYVHGVHSVGTITEYSVF